MGLYWDDGLAITNGTPRKTEKVKKETCQIFNLNRPRITIKANKQIVNFLYVKLNLNKITHEPFRKFNTTLQYVHHESNQPQTITRNIPTSINKRLSTLSSNAFFDQASPPYQKSLNDGHQYTLHCKPITNTRWRNRPQNNILWYNLPFSKNVCNNIGHRFIALVDKHLKATILEKSLIATPSRLVTATWIARNW